jgi:ribonuclease R
VEREVVDLYRAVLMRDKIGERFEGTVTGMVGTGVFVALDSPFVDVLVRLEDLGGERYELDDDGLRAVASRSGDVVSLGDRMMVEVIDVAILRRSVYGRRVGREGDEEGRPRRKTVQETASRGTPRGKKTVEKQIRGAKRKIAARTATSGRGGPSKKQKGGGGGGGGKKKTKVKKKGR